MSGVLEGQAGVVTGGSQGLGRAIAETFAAEGARVAILDVGGAAEAAEQVGGGAIGIDGDVTDEAGITKAFAEVAETFGSFDFLVNNAGVRDIVSILDYPIDAFRRTIDINLTGTFICLQAAARIMVKRGGGRIVNMASIAGMLPLLNRAAYDASKAGVIALTKATTAELAAQGITCNAIAPGVIETPLSAEYFKDATMVDAITRSTPLGSWGQPDVIAKAALYLCGNGADFVHGHTLVVDGGWMATKGY